MVQIILDTNMILLVFSRGIRIEEDLGQIIDGQLELCVMSQTLEELQKLKTAHAKSALALIKAREYVIIQSDGSYADDAIVAQVQKNPCVVVTADRELQKRVKNAGGRIITATKSRLYGE